MAQSRKIAFLFPGQGAQYPGMGKDFFDAYPVARHTFEEADDLLGRKLSTIIFDGPEAILTETKNSQLGIYITSIAILRTLNTLFPQLTPSICAGLSLGEYTALTAAGILPFTDGVNLVGKRGQFMNDACEATKGTMAVVVGLDADAVKEIVAQVALPEDLWAANFNCPGQVVLSGTLKGIEAGSAAAKAKGAKRVLPLQVHGAFHSGLMMLAEERLAPYVQHTTLKDGTCQVVMNVTGKPGKSQDEIRRNLIAQVTHSVCWEQGMRHIIGEGVDLCLEIGCGKVLAGFNKRIDPNAACLSIEKVGDLASLESAINS